MKFPSLRRTGALLLALALVCSLLVLPAAAASIGGDFTLNVGETRPLEVSDDMTGPIRWFSTNEQVATVTESGGLVTAVGEGSSEIIAVDTASNISASCTVTVKKESVSADGVRLDTGFLQKEVGDSSLRLTATLSPPGSTGTITWESSDPSVVSVDQQGVLRFLAVGSANITATVNGHSDSCFVKVTARPLKVTPESISLPQGGSATLSVNTDQPVVWTSSDYSIVDVDRNTGVIHVASNLPEDQEIPHVTITAQAVSNPSQYAICVVTVIEPPTPTVTSVNISDPFTDAYRYVDPGKTMILTASVEPADASAADRRVTWSVDPADGSIATVNSSTGVITGVAPGRATIIARAGGNNPREGSREIEVSGIVLNYTEKSASGGIGTTKYLKPTDVIPVYQYRDITAKWELFGNAKNKSVTWTSSNDSIAQVVAGRVTANYPGEATITASVDGTGFTASFKVRISEDVADVINVNMGSDPSYSFSGLLSDLNSRSQSKVGAPLDAVYNLKVSTKNGVLYYRYTSSNNPGHGVGGTERYYYQAASSGQMAIRDVSFVPLPGFDGTAVVDYNAVATNGDTFTGTIRIQASASGDVNYSTGVEQPVDLVAEHFSAVCKGRTGRAISYVTFTQPLASRGTLYENYSSSGLYSSKVISSTRYYATSNPSIDSITFVPAAGYTGDVSIPYRCVDSSGAFYTGTVTITVSGSGGTTTGSRDVEYSTALNQRQDLNGSDFNDACQRATGYSLERIRFDSLPSSSAGTLYLNYTNSSSTQVSTARSYYRSTTPRISNISFVPARNYSGTVTIPFTGTNTNGDTFSGSLVIHVADGTGTVHYNTPRNQAVTFNASDFNDACRRANGTTLSSIRFTSLPSSSAGTLYYNYLSASSTGSRVSTGTDYRRSGSPSLSSVTFVPASGYSGTVSIPFTGYDDNGVRFTGTVTITVGSGSQIISYSAAANGFVRFNASDFNNACRSATGDALNYVRFGTTSTSYGTLYYQYNTSSRTGTSVSTSTGYYYSGGSRLLSDVSFAANSAAGTTTIGYTGYSTRGDSFSGTVEIVVSGGSSVITTVRYTGSSAPIRFRSSDFQAACQAALGTSLSYVQFSSLPAAGHLYQNYSGPARTGTGVTAAARYTLQDLDQISYVPRAEYQGTLTIPYTAYDTQGASHSSAVEIQLSTSYCTTPFTDTAYGWDWAKPSIEYLRQSGVTSGYRDGTFRPGQSISRGEFTLMICRAFQFPTTGNSGFPDVPAGSTYAGAVAAARDLGIVQGNNGLFQPDRPITRQSAMTMICRALEAAGQSVPAADSSLLASYTDGSQVSAFARSSVASLVQMGAVRGNSSMRLNPTAAISRAEMAVILHRVLTR